MPPRLNSQVTSTTSAKFLADLALDGCATALAGILKQFPEKVSSNIVRAVSSPKIITHCLWEFLAKLSFIKHFSWAG